MFAYFNERVDQKEFEADSAHRKNPVADKQQSAGCNKLNTCQSDLLRLITKLTWQVLFEHRLDEVKNPKNDSVDTDDNPRLDQRKEKAKLSHDRSSWCKNRLNLVCDLKLTRS